MNGMDGMNGPTGVNGPTGIDGLIGLTGMNGPTGAAPAPAGRIELNIGALELSGFPATQRFAIAGAVEQALADLIRARGWPSSRPEQRPTAHAGLEFAHDADPSVLGRAIAEAIFRAAGSASAARRSP